MFHSQGSCMKLCDTPLSYLHVPATRTNPRATLVAKAGKDGLLPTRYSHVETN